MDYFKHISLMILFVTASLIFYVNQNPTTTGYGILKHYNLHHNKSIIIPKKIVVIGGSSSAGAGQIPKKCQYPTLLGEHFKNSTVLNHAHGTTNIFYSSLMFDSLVPEDTDLIIWEYTINEGGASINNPTQVFNSFRMFIRLLKSHKNRPKIILLLLWTSPFTIPPSRDTENVLRPLLKYFTTVDVFEAINRRTSKVLEKRDYVADAHHLNRGAHIVLSRELVDIIQRGAIINEYHKTPDFGEKLFNFFEYDSKIYSMLVDPPSINRYKFNALQYRECCGKKEKNRSDRVAVAGSCV